MTWEKDLLAAMAGFVVALVTSPVGVSGAVFLAPVQLTLLDVPNPQLTPTNLLYNLVSGPGALLRHLRRRSIAWGLVGAIVRGSAPGVVLGAYLRVHVAADPTAFQLVAAAVLLPTGVLLLLRPARPAGSTPPSSGPSARTVSVLAFVTGVAGGMYGIGGGSLLGPVLVALGASLTTVVPAALASTYLTSAVGAAAFAVFALGTTDAVAPDVSLGVAAGLGGLVGGSLGARLQPHLPETLLRRGLAGAAVALALVYLATAAVDVLRA